jgi:hypothetical protein
MEGKPDETGIFPVVEGSLAVYFDEIIDRLENIHHPITPAGGDIRFGIQPGAEIPAGGVGITQYALRFSHLPEASVIWNQDLFEKDLTEPVRDPAPDATIVAGCQGERPLQAFMIKFDLSLECTPPGKILILFFDVIFELYDLLHKELGPLLVHLPFLVEKGRSKPVDPIGGIIHQLEDFTEFRRGRIGYSSLCRCPGEVGNGARGTCPPHVGLVKRYAESEAVDLSAGDEVEADIISQSEEASAPDRDPEGPHEIRALLPEGVVPADPEKDHWKRDPKAQAAVGLAAEKTEISLPFQGQ